MTISVGSVAVCVDVFVWWWLCVGCFCFSVALERAALGSTARLVCFGVYSSISSCAIAQLSLENDIYIYYHHEEYLTVSNMSLNYTLVTPKLFTYNVSSKQGNTKNHHQ